MKRLQGSGLVCQIEAGHSNLLVIEIEVEFRMKTLDIFEG